MRIKTCQSLAEIMQIRQFLLDSNARLPKLYNWEPRRWEGKLFHQNTKDILETRLSVAREVAQLIDENDEIRAVVIPEYPGGAFLQCHPGDEEAQEILIDWSIENLSQLDHKGKWMEIWCNENDVVRAELLLKKGFKPTSEHQNRRHQVLDKQKPTISIPSNYTIRNVTNNNDDFENMATLLNASFGRAFHTAEEYRNFASLAPSYQYELEIVVVAPNGDFAAHAGFTAHDKESFVVVEPVCTHPEHQNLGLARAAISEGLNRCISMGIKDAYVEAWYSNPVSNHVYQAMGFEKYACQYIWRKVF